MEYLVGVDIQNDFITGALGTKEAQEAFPRMLGRIQGFQGRLWLTQDTHGEDYAQTQEGRLLPVPHCLSNTPGWDFPGPLADYIINERESRRAIEIFQKGTFGSVDMGAAAAGLAAKGEMDSILLIGLCTDICVVSNALLLKAFAPGVPIAVDASCCAATTPEKHRAALATMASCQIGIIQ